MAGASGCGTKDTLDSAVASLPDVGLKELTARVGSVLPGRGGSLGVACGSWGTPSKGLVQRITLCLLYCPVRTMTIKLVRDLSRGCSSAACDAEYHGFPSLPCN